MVETTVTEYETQELEVERLRCDECGCISDGESESGWKTLIETTSDEIRYRAEPEYSHKGGDSGTLDLADGSFVGMSHSMKFSNGMKKVSFDLPIEQRIDLCPGCYESSLPNVDEGFDFVPTMGDVVKVSTPRWFHQSLTRLAQIVAFPLLLGLAYAIGAFGFWSVSAALVVILIPLGMIVMTLAAATAGV